jgi:SNF2 family DNA or RNA helicase
MYNDLLQHQKEGLNWLIDQHASGRGSILADEMGLGKTISAIAILSCLKYTYKLQNKTTGPILIVCPGTVINQWQEEITKWDEQIQILNNVLIYNSQTKAKTKTKS